MKRRTVLGTMALGMVSGVGGMLAALDRTARAAVSANPAKYPLTIEAMQERYADEVRAFHKYSAYSHRAIKDGYPNIAYLFTSLASSESVHARNFRQILQGFGVEPKPVVDMDMKVSSTRNNLKEATTVEAEEINHKYPEILKQIGGENHAKSVEVTTWAWKAEEQHRKLIVKMQKNVVKWWGIVSSRIEESPVTYYVCQVCGSTLVKVPKETCPICGSPASAYKEIAPPPGYSNKAE
jgi:rubrerythrin